MMPEQLCILESSLSRRNLLKISLIAGISAVSLGLPDFAQGAEERDKPINHPDHAVLRFLKSMNCSQAIMETYGPELGMPVIMARRVAAALAGGMGMGSECGAVTGAFLVIGLKYGKTQDVDPLADKATFTRVAEFVKEFKARHRHLACSALLGTDMGTEEGVQEALKKGLFTELCPKYVRSASEILDKVLL